MIRTKPTLPPGSATTNFAHSKSGVTFDAGLGHDTVLGSKYADLFQGGEGNDSLSGKKGNDTLQGGAGPDTVTGGAGSDTFVFASGDLITSRAASNGHKGQVDKIADFQGAGTSGAGEQDVIRLEGFGAGTTLRYVGQDGPGHGSPQIYEVVDPTTAGADGLISVSLANNKGNRLTADDVVVVPPPGPQITITNITEGGNGSSYGGSISADGSTVVFTSEATDLVTGQVDENGHVDVFVYEVATGRTLNVTQNGDADSYGSASLSADGSRVAFTSLATNLVEGRGDANYSSDVFVYDAATGGTINLTLTRGFGYSYSPSISADGSSVAYAGDTDGNNTTDIFIADATTGAEDGGGSIRVTDSGYQGDIDYEGGSSGAPSLSADGSRVAFHSDATKLIESEVDLNDFITDVFVYDVATDTITNITQGGTGYSFGATLSADGSLVAFTSYSINLVDGELGNAALANIFIHDLATGKTINISQGEDENSGAAAISADGSTVVFSSRATNIVDGEVDQNGTVSDVFVYDVATGETVNVTQGRNGESFNPTISADGSTGTFYGVDANGESTDVFVWELG